MTKMRKAILCRGGGFSRGRGNAPLTLRHARQAPRQLARPLWRRRAQGLQQEALFYEQVDEPRKPESDQANRRQDIERCLETLGVRRLPKSKLGKVPGEAAQQITEGTSSHTTPRPPGGRLNAPGSGAPGIGLPIGLPQVLGTNDALSAALITTIGGRDTQFDEVALIADWDGREDCVADHGSKIDDFSGVAAGSEIDFTLTRAAISEHTRGNGHPFFNVYYYGDSVGNAYMGIDVAGSSLVDIVFSFNVPATGQHRASNGFLLSNRTAGDCTDDQVTVTGIAVNPVADLGDFLQHSVDSWGSCLCLRAGH